MVQLHDSIGRTLEISAPLWRLCLGLAAEHGWRPQGTLPPPVRWDGQRNPAEGRSYLSACGQKVHASDAAAFAQALGVAIQRGHAGAEQERMEQLQRFASRAFLVCEGGVRASAEPAVVAGQLANLAGALGLSQEIRTEVPADMAERSRTSRY